MCQTSNGWYRRRAKVDGWELQMSVRMPEADGAVLARRERIVAALRTIVPGEGVIATTREMRPFESDGLTAYRQLPMVVVLPETTEQVSQVLRYCHDEGIKVVPRGAGTSLSGGALPLADGVLLGMAKFNRIRDIDFDNRVVVVEPGVTNLAVTNAVAHAGFYYAPDPSSQIACTIGGNVAENSGGVHCLKYGMTTNNVLGCEMVLMNGENLPSTGYRWLGLDPTNNCVVNETHVRLAVGKNFSDCSPVKGTYRGTSEHTLEVEGICFLKMGIAQKTPMKLYAPNRSSLFPGILIGDTRNNSNNNSIYVAIFNTASISRSRSLVVVYTWGVMRTAFTFSHLMPTARIW